MEPTVWSEIWQAAASTGLWAMLFVALFFIQLKDAKTREEKYQETIRMLGEKLNIVNQINDAVNDIKDDLNKPRAA
jgi:Protein of unknown function (DUF2762).